MSTLSNCVSWPIHKKREGRVVEQEKGGEDKPTPSNNEKGLDAEEEWKRMLEEKRRLGDPYTYEMEQSLEYWKKYVSEQKGEISDENIRLNTPLVTLIRSSNLSEEKKKELLTSLGWKSVYAVAFFLSPSARSLHGLALTSVSHEFLRDPVFEEIDSLFFQGGLKDWVKKGTPPWENSRIHSSYKWWEDPVIPDNVKEELLEEEKEHGFRFNLGDPKRRTDVGERIADRREKRRDRRESRRDNRR